MSIWFVWKRRRESKIAQAALDKLKGLDVTSEDAPKVLRDAFNVLDMDHSGCVWRRRVVEACGGGV